MNIRAEDGTFYRPYIRHHYKWDWRDDLHIPIIQHTVLKLPFEYIQRVRIIAIWEGDHIGMVHRDSEPSLNHGWRESGHGVINLNILNGGAVLKLEISPGNVIDIDDDCFTFNESLWHGTSRGNSTRIQINVTGRFAENVVSLLR